MALIDKEAINEAGRGLAKIIRLLASVIIAIATITVIATQWTGDIIILEFIVIVMILDLAVRSHYFVD